MGYPSSEDIGMKELAAALKQVRSTRGWSLREAEDKTGVSNGYLYLLEQGRIREPSPAMLKKLSEAYKIDYVHLMELAGYLEPSKKVGKAQDTVAFALSGTIQDLSTREKEEVRDFIQFIRSRKPKTTH